MLPFITFALAAPPPLLEPVRTGATSAYDAALVVAIEDYAFLPDVPHARRDLQAVVDLLVHTRGVPAESVVTLEGASVEQLRNGLARAVAARGPGGTVWVYFAGHGAAAPESGALLLVGDDAKADPSVFSARSLPVDELLAALPDASVVLLDTCWGGAARSGESLLPGARLAVPTYASPPPRLTVWTAASPSETSVSYSPAGHGAFTYFVVGALRGWADGALTGAPDGQVDLDEAEAYVQRALGAVGVSAQRPLLEGPRPAALIAGSLEAGPSLADLPRQGSAQPTPSVGVLGGIVTPVGGSYPLVQEGFRPPLRWLDKSRVADANDRIVPPSSLYQALSADVSGQEAHRSYLRTFRGANAGATLGVLGAVTAVTAGSLAATFGVLDPSDATFDVSMGLTGAGAAVMGGGVALAVGTRGTRQRAREELVDYLNDRMEPAPGSEPR